MLDQSLILWGGPADGIRITVAEVPYDYYHPWPKPGVLIDQPRATVAIDQDTAQTMDVLHYRYSGQCRDTHGDVTGVLLKREAFMRYVTPTHT